MFKSVASRINNRLLYNNRTRFYSTDKPQAKLEDNSTCNSSSIDKQYQDIKEQVDQELDAIDKQKLLYDKQLKIMRYNYPVSLLACKSVGFIVPLCMFGLFIGPLALFPAFYGLDRAEKMFVDSHFPQIKKSK
ncbi:MAG: hypothetical protein WD512_19370 [Candidatus Paceibacterota bacterium]